MFDDARQKKVVFVAHCILNQNAISDGTAEYPGAVQEIVRILIDANIGIVQMPCPELLCLGLDRGNPEASQSPIVEENTRIRAQMGKYLMRSKIDRLVKNLVFQVTEYRRHGFEILGIIGMNRSPSCGVDTTSDHNEEISGRGIFIGLLIEALENQGISIKTIGIKASETDRALNAVKSLIESH